MVERLIQGGFRLDFTPIYWTYASGFPKAGNIGKLVDKRLGVEPIKGEAKPYTNDKAIQNGSFSKGNYERVQTYFTKPNSDAAKALDGSYAGFQPKPAVEVIIVAMKPLSEKTYVDQALANGKGISWLDDCRVPTTDTATADRYKYNINNSKNTIYEKKGDLPAQGVTPQGRFPANLLVSDDVLNDDYSRFFTLDTWADTLPFLAVPKASKSEKNKGLEHRTPALRAGVDKMMGDPQMKTGSGNERTRLHLNNHPTVKPLKLMSYLITLFTRPDDIVLDPFVGSGTTCVAAEMLERESIGIEREAEYAEIAKARLAHIKPQPKQLPPEQPTPGQPPVTIDNLIQASLFEL
jgi:site-specific DNA-methyltransferase (adenine-specific)